MNHSSLNKSTVEGVHHSGYSLPKALLILLSIVYMSFWQAPLSKALFALSSVLTFLPTAAALARPYSSLSFSDINNHWAAGCIDGAGKEALMKGYLDGRFYPNNTMTRAEFAAVMVKAFPSAPVIRDEPNFSDVSPDFWGWDAIKAAYSRGFLAGYPGNLFRPAQTISRVQALIVIANAQTRSTQPTSAAADAAVLSQYFQDAQSIPTYARPGIATATRSGLVVNYPSVNQLRPNDSITRAEATALLCRINRDGSDARHYVDTTYIAAFGDRFDIDGLPKVTESELTLLAALEPGYRENFFLRSQKVDNRLFFIDDSTDVADLWQTDGTSVGTKLVRALDNGEDPTVSTDGVRFIGASEDRVWLLTYPYNGYSAKRAALWSSDRTASTTQEAADFSLALAEALSQAKDVIVNDFATTAVNGRIPLFIQNEQDTQLWMTDGKSSAGTKQIATFSANFRDDNPYPSQRFATTDNYIFFIAAAQPNAAFSDSAALWRTDGTPEGTIRLQTIGQADYREALIAWQNQVYFTATTPEFGKELWVSDGTTRGTRLLQDIYPGPDSSDVTVIGQIEDTLFILGNSSEDKELWSTAGSPESTRLVKRLGYSDESIEKDVLYPNNGRQLFFNASDRSSAEILVTDGTDEETRAIYLGSFNANNGVAFKDMFFFSGSSLSGEELWVSNGSSLEAYQLADLTPGETMTPPRCSRPIAGDPNSGGCTPVTYESKSTSPGSLTVLGNYLYFRASDNRLFRTDGTVGGLELIEMPSRGDSAEGSLVKLGERILFTTRGDRSKLWSIDTTQRPLRSGFKRHISSGVFSIDYPQNWYVKSSERDTVSIWNQQPSRQSFPPGFAKTEVFIRPDSFDDITSGQFEGERGGYNSGTIIKSEFLTITGKDAYRVFFEGGENGEDAITTIVRYSDNQTAVITSFFTSGETHNVPAILEMHESFKVN